MPATLAAKTAALLEDLPPYLAGDAAAQSFTDAIARELQRIEDVALALAHEHFPQYSTDVYGLLGLWEAFLGLPVKPPGIDISQRRDKVLGHLRKRKTAAGSDWSAALAQSMGNTPYTYEEGPNPSTVLIRYPYDPTSYNTAQVAALARQITPAHLSIEATYNEGFIIGVSLIGSERL